MIDPAKYTPVDFAGKNGSFGITRSAGNCPIICDNDFGLLRKQFTQVTQLCVTLLAIFISRERLITLEQNTIMLESLAMPLPFSERRSGKGSVQLLKLINNTNDVRK